jgi:hypothetical protein
VKLVTLQDALTEFFESPTARRYRRVREMVIRGDDYRPQSSTLVELADLVQHGDFAAALALVDELTPGWSLCPRVHFLAGMAAEGLGDADEVELRRFMAQSCLDGIVATGAGSRTRPWVVSYPSDVQDVLTRQGFKAISQQLIADGDSWLCAMSSRRKTYWFDVTELVAAGVEAFEPAMARARS